MGYDSIQVVMNVMIYDNDDAGDDNYDDDNDDRKTTDV